MSAPSLQIALSIFDAQLSQVASGTLSSLAANGNQVSGQLQLSLGTETYQMEVSGKPIEIPTGAVILLNGAVGHLAVSLSLIQGVYIPAYSGAILLSNGALYLPFNFIGTPNAPTPPAGTPELLAQFVEQLKQLNTQKA
jgi:hypothetical protein